MSARASQGDTAQMVFVAGLSGSGKTTAMAALEDGGFYCVDNLPPPLVTQFLDLCRKATPPIRKIALAVDTREERFLERLPDVLEELRGRGAEVAILFLDCANEILEKRYRETRRVHPLSPEGSVEAGIERERGLLTDLVALADYRIDTSSLNVHQLKDAVVQYVAGGGRATVVNLLTFGFRHGTPHAAELLFDLRFLPNPYFVEALRPRSGEDPEVAAHVLENDEGRELFQRLLDFVSYLLPLYDREGKAYVTIGIGCTGGRHRSVAVATALANSLREAGREVNLEHRDKSAEGAREGAREGTREATREGSNPRRWRGREAVSVGVVIVTHYRLGEEFLQALRLIIPDGPDFYAVSIDPNESVEDMRASIAAALKSAESGDGVLVLTDMFGGTPSNISLSFLDEHHVEVVTGVNLPMLIKLATLREEKPLEELAAFIKDYGQRNISVASELLPEGSR